MLFDSPKIKKMMEQENEFLAKGKIDWCSKILPIAQRILACEDSLSDDDFTDYSAEISEEYDFKDDTTIKINDFHRAQKNQLIQSKQELDEQIKHIANKDHNEAVENLANKIKFWKNRDLTQEEKEREEKITKDNLLLAKVEFLSRINNKDSTLIELTKNAEGLVYRESLPDQYSWQDVAISMLKFPEEVVLDYKPCPYCGEEQVKLYFHSPSWTWAMMCGVGGEMVFCPKCQLQTGFSETIRN